MFTQSSFRATAWPVLLSAVLFACSGDSGPSDADRAAWRDWALDLVGSYCTQQRACGVNTGAACGEAGAESAEKASCDAAVSFYLAHREALEACLDPYPSDCSLTLGEACPAFSEVSFEELCP